MRIRGSITHTIDLLPVPAALVVYPQHLKCNIQVLIRAFEYIPEPTAETLGATRILHFNLHRSGKQSTQATNPVQTFQACGSNLWKGGECVRRLIKTMCGLK